MLLSIFESLKKYIPISQMRHKQILDERIYLITENHKTEMAALSDKVYNLLDKLTAASFKKDINSAYHEEANVIFKIVISGALIHCFVDSKCRHLEDIAEQIGKQVEYKTIQYLLDKTAD